MRSATAKVLSLTPFTQISSNDNFRRVGVEPHLRLVSISYIQGLYRTSNTSFPADKYVIGTTLNVREIEDS